MNILNKYITKIKDSTLNKLNDVYCRRLRKQNKNLDFTIISNNCWGGGIYEDLNLKYNSPTVGLFFYAPCYIEFLEDFNELIEVDLKFIQKSKYKISNEYRATNKHYYPIGVLNNVEIHFLHYKSEIEALDKWNYRKARINKKNMFIKFCDRDLCNLELIERFEKLSFSKKIFFSNKKLSGINSAIFLKKYKNNDSVGDLYTYRWSYRFKFSIIKWLND